MTGRNSKGGFLAWVIVLAATVFAAKPPVPEVAPPEDLPPVAEPPVADGSAAALMPVTYLRANPLNYFGQCRAPRKLGEVWVAICVLARQDRAANRLRQFLGYDISNQALPLVTMRELDV